MNNKLTDKAITFDKRTICSLAFMTAVLVLLALYPLRSMSYAGFVPVALLVTWLIYSFIAPVALLKRRALLSRTTKKSSGIRRFLWNSAFVHIRVAVFSVPAAAIALIAVSGFEPIEWVFLFLSLPVLLLVIGVIRVRIAGELNDNYEYWIAIRFSIALVLIALATVFALYNFFLAEVPFYANLSIIEAAGESYRSACNEAAMREVGWLLGVNEAANTAVWHLMQTASQTSGSVALKVLCWLVFLFLSALKIGAVLLVLGGVLVLVDSFLRSGKQPLGETVFARSFTFTMIVLFAGYLLLTQVNIGQFLAETGERVVKGMPLIFDPCTNRQVAAQEQFQAETSNVLSQVEQEAYARMRNEIDERVERLFSGVEAGVDSFLDWNFSLKGQYQQLAYMGASAIGNGFSDYVASQIDLHVAIAISAEESDLDNALKEVFFAEVDRIQSRQAKVMVELAETLDCLKLPELAFTGEDFINKSLVGAGSGTGAGAGIIAARGGIRIGSRAVGKAGAKRIIAAAVARLSTKVVTSSSAGAAGTFCGPMVIVCGPLFAGATWVATDLAINSADEALNREKMKDDILMSIAEEKEQLKEDYMAFYQRALAGVVDEIEESQRRMFNPMRDGV